jgi:SagB-type dehydrogenase family enzyme
LISPNDILIRNLSYPKKKLVVDDLTNKKRYSLDNESIKMLSKFYHQDQQYRKFPNSWEQKLKLWKEYRWNSPVLLHLATYNFQFLDYSKPDAFSKDISIMEDYKKKWNEPTRYKEYRVKNKIILAKFDKKTTIFNTDNKKEYDLNKFPFSIFSDLMYLSFGKIGQIKFPVTDPLILRTSPSGGSRHHIESYVLVNGVQDIPEGLYHYSVKEHALDPIKSNNIIYDKFKQFYPFSVFFTTIFERNMWRYRDPWSYRVIWLDAGHIMATYSKLLQFLKLKNFFNYFFNAFDISKFLNLNLSSELPLAINLIQNNQNICNNIDSAHESEILTVEISNMRQQYTISPLSVLIPPNSLISQKEKFLFLSNLGIPFNLPNNIPIIDLIYYLSKGIMISDISKIALKLNIPEQHLYFIIGNLIKIGWLVSNKQLLFLKKLTKMWEKYNWQDPFLFHFSYISKHSSNVNNPNVSSLIKNTNPLNDKNKIKLKKLSNKRSRLADILIGRRSANYPRKSPISLECLESLLYDTFNNIDNNFTNNKINLKELLSNYSISLYLIANNVSGLKKGVYEYSFLDHSLNLYKTFIPMKILSKISVGQINAEAPCGILFVVDFKNIIPYYKNMKIYPILYNIIGYLAQNFIIEATSQKLTCFVTAATNDEFVNSWLDFIPFSKELLYVLTIGSKL